MISQMENQKEEPKQTHSDFSIEHILNRAGNSSKNLSLDPYSWLQCTRYCPPKIQRSQKRDGPQKRQLGRHPRIPFTSQQLSLLEEKFQQSPYLSSEEVIALSKTLDLADIRVKIWFQNRRARERREKTDHQPKKNQRKKQNQQDYHQFKHNHHKCDYHQRFSTEILYCPTVLLITPRFTPT